MNLSSHDLKSLCNNAIDAALSAGAYVSATRPINIEKKNNGGTIAAQVVTEVDRESQARILEMLKPAIENFDLGLLTEESPDNGSRLEKDYFWCVDPIDGTLSFIEGVPGYAVSIALVSRDGTPRIGVVYDPVDQVLYHAIHGVGAFRNSVPWSPDRSQSDGPVRIFTDRSELAKPEFEPRAHAMNAQWGTCGGAVMNAIWCLEHPQACYFKLTKEAVGGGAIWDFAATACIYSEVGAWVSDVYGVRLNLNRVDSVFMNQFGVLFATDSETAQRFLN